jgi:hypothetical protein
MNRAQKKLAARAKQRAAKKAKMEAAGGRSKYAIRRERRLNGDFRNSPFRPAPPQRRVSTEGGAEETGQT